MPSFMDTRNYTNFTNTNFYAICFKKPTPSIDFILSKIKYPFYHDNFVYSVRTMRFDMNDKLFTKIVNLKSEINHEKIKSVGNYNGKHERLRKRF